MVNLLESRRRILLTTPHLESPTPANPLTFKTSMTTKLKEGKVYFTPVQEGTGDPSPDNVRPISGWDVVTVTACGKNLFDKSKCTTSRLIDSTGLIVNNSSWFVTDFIPLQGTKVSCHGSRRANTTYHAFYDENKQLVSVVKQEQINNLTIPSKARYIRCSCANEYANAFQVELNSAPTSYEPYTETKITIPFPKTIYGGYVDLVNGDVVEEYDGIDLSTVGFYQYSTSNHCWSSAIPEMVTGDQLTSNDIFCDSYKPYSKASILSRDHDLGIWGYNANQRRIIIRNDAYIGEDGKYDIDAFNESLKDKYLYYPLATPIHRTIDPQVIRPLKGVNNIYSDANGNIEVKFWKH